MATTDTRDDREDPADDTDEGAASSGVAAGAQQGGASLGAADLKDLGSRYAMESGLVEALREGFREAKRAPGEAKRLQALLNGLARKHESEGRHTADEIGRVIASIQRGRGEE
jgi:hypothetical protein